MKEFIFIFLLPVGPVSAQEWPVKNGGSPTQDVEFVTVPKFDSDPINGSPFRIVLRATETRKIFDFFLWNGDLGDVEAHKKTRAYWSLRGDFVAIYMRGGRLIGFTEYFAVVDGRLKKIKPPDVEEKILEDFGKKEFGPNGGTTPVRWKNKNELIVSINGSAGAIPFHYHATLKFFGNRDVIPGCRLTDLGPVKKGNEQGDGSGEVRPTNSSRAD